MKKISYIVASRNDSYCGDSVGRLQTTLNHTGDILAKHNVLDKSEIILSDWASPEANGGLINVLRLNKNTKSIIKIVETPHDIAQRHQGDSPFSEVHAMNVGLRKSEGRFFARIDQDTLIGERFINWFYNEFHEKDYGFDWPLVAFSGRRNLSSSQSENPQEWIYNDSKSREVEICHPNNLYSKLVANGKNIFLFYGGAVGIMIVERDLYIREKGFNEEFVYMNNMDTEFMNRLRNFTKFYNLGLKVDSDFYHLNHSREEAAANDVTQPHASETGKRKTNSNLIRNQQFANNNPDNWGLEGEDLLIHTFE